MKSSIFLAAMVAALLAGCQSKVSDQMSDMTGRRSFMLPYNATIPYDKEPEIYEAYKKAFKCWADGPHNDQGFVLKKIWMADDGGILKAFFVYPSDPDKEAIVFRLTMMGRWSGGLSLIAEGPERDSAFSKYIFSQHGSRYIALCNAGTLSVRR
ncbi:hypothetical protein [Roseibium sp.]|uniref:hypothetical protein n=1 Tax=Roseibium sp. TaxID=1936156 RepID=UPI003A9732F7